MAPKTAGRCRVFAAGNRFRFLHGVVSAEYERVGIDATEKDSTQTIIQPAAAAANLRAGASADTEADALGEQTNHQFQEFVSALLATTESSSATNSEKTAKENEGEGTTTEKMAEEGTEEEESEEEKEETEKTKKKEGEDKRWQGREKEGKKAESWKERENRTSRHNSDGKSTEKQTEDGVGEEIFEKSHREAAEGENPQDIAAC